ncbi:MAG: FxsA family protein [Planctomycetes bacterium]|nr:FxsA family protein [Planctomycetota bacterium]
MTREATLLPDLSPAMLQLLLLFTIIPLVELWLFVQFSGLFGFWTTFALVIGTGMAGAALARWQGWQALERVRTEMRQGMRPAQGIALNSLGTGPLCSGHGTDKLQRPMTTGSTIALHP